MAEQTCEACEFGREQRCYWPYYADSDGETHDALLDPMPPWAEREIEYNTGHRITGYDCQRCPCFEERAPEPAAPVRCPNTRDMFEKEKQ